MTELELYRAIVNRDLICHSNNKDIHYRLMHSVSMTLPDGRWVDAVCYQEHTNYNGTIYVRPVDNFNNFSVAAEKAAPAITDFR